MDGHAAESARPTAESAAATIELAQTRRKRVSTGFALANDVEHTMRLPRLDERSLPSFVTMAVASLALGVASIALDQLLGARTLAPIAAHALIAVVVAACFVARDRHRAELAWAATHDPLTGLLNRRGLAQQRALASAAVAYVDLDGFKRLNDRLGHAAGDAVLVALARALGGVRPTDRVARLGGDEFVIVMPAGTREIAERIVERVRDRFAAELDALGIDAAFSAGIAIVEDAVDLRSLLRSADRAMYEQKRSAVAQRQAASATPAALASPAAPRARRWVRCAGH
jgi:diguanylate cyclase (GGDEF)-like protein